MDRTHNLALLAVKVDLPALPLAERHTFQRNEKVKTISNPDSGSGDPEENVVVQGNWLARGLLTANQVFDGFRLTTKPTCLGGPVVNGAGKIVGIITFRHQGQRERVYGIPVRDLHMVIRFAESKR
jgi:S1-C subfamily serine protease